MDIEFACRLVSAELDEARRLHKPLNSAHEGYAVLKEEVDELWEEVKKKQSQRSHAKLAQEAKQVAAMAIRFMMDVCP